MKNKGLIIGLSAATALSFSSCSGFKKTNSKNYDIIPLTGENEATDYSKDGNWMYKQTDGGHEVDLIYFYPTVTQEPNDLILSRISREMKESATYAFAETASCFAPYTNVFAPFYTQLPIGVDLAKADEYIAKYKIDPSKLMSGYLEMITYTHVRTDVYAALDYYFEHFNKGRPFILAGHSQGSAVCQVILREYMRVHPKYLSRMVVTYSGGFAITRDYMKEHTHLKYAEGETDTGVIVSWTTEAPGGSEYSVVTPKNSICINPINWKTDDTNAEASENKGTLSPVHWLHCWEIIHDDTINAQINTERGVVVTNADTNKYPLETNIPVAGDKSFHTFDYAFFYMNLRENVKKRIETYLGKLINI